MTDCYFTNLEKIIIGELSGAQHSVMVAVAWINFEVYRDVFLQLLVNGVKVKIIINDDAINRNFHTIIDNLINYGAKIQMKRYGGLMHHKFCIIDKQRCLFGSFNWTINANEKNIEDVNICDDSSLVNGYLLEFKALWELTAEDIKLLRSPLRCPSCGDPQFNIMVMDQEGDCQTKIEVIQQCSCDQKRIFLDYFDINVYMGCIGIIDEFNDNINIASQMGDVTNLNKIYSMRDFSLSCYLASVRFNRMNVPLLQAVGVKIWRWLNKNDGYWCYKIIWKERGTENYIDDEYPIY